MQTEKVINHIVEWLKAYANKAHIKGFVVGVSGGIDSAVSSVLCAKTGLKVLCLEMPIHQGINQVTRAQEHIDQLKTSYANVNSANVNLTPVYESFKSVLPGNSDSKNTIDLALANSRARLRMTTLYFFAGINNYLVCGTGNKVEDFGIGFFTKYGDGGVDLSPIADLMKSEVFKLGHVLNVPESILSARPTDGLFADSRSDEDQIGASYDELEWAMLMTEQSRSIDDFDGREKELMEIYLNRNRTNMHKMKPIPVCEIPKNLRN
jgi:NAD+ synthase